MEGMSKDNEEIMVYLYNVEYVDLNEEHTSDGAEVYSMKFQNENPSELMDVLYSSLQEDYYERMCAPEEWIDKWINEHALRSRKYIIKKFDIDPQDMEKDQDLEDFYFYTYSKEWFKQEHNIDIDTLPDDVPLMDSLVPIEDVRKRTLILLVENISEDDMDSDAGSMPDLVPLSTDKVLEEDAPDDF